MTFEDDLTKRRINVAAFAAGDPKGYAAWRTLYEQVHPNTFYTSVKMIINDVRRQFWLEEVPKPAVVTAIAGKPVMRRATGAVPSTASAIPDEPSPSVDRTPEPAPEPRGRAVIRRPPVTEATIPEVKEQPQKKPSTAENEVNTPETPKPGRARPVFKRPTAETSASTSAESETGNQPPSASEETKTAAEAAKLPRPRPVFRKPAAQTPEEETKNEAPIEGNATSLPAHSNPDPEAAPKPSRPRPVFKRPTSISDEIEKTTTTAETHVSGDNSLDDQVNVAEEKPAAETPEAPKPPRPRPVFKRSVPASPTETDRNDVIPEAAATENNLTNTVVDDPTESTPEPAKPPRPRPVFKRPSTANLEQNAVEAIPDPSAEINPEPSPVSEAPKLSRPRPVIKRSVPPTIPEVPEQLVADTPTSGNIEPVTENIEVREQEKTLNEPNSIKDSSLPETTQEPLPVKPPRPRPIFKRPAPSGPTAETPPKPETE